MQTFPPGGRTPSLSRTRGLIGILAMTFLLVGAVQAMSPASAAAMIDLGNLTNQRDCEKFGIWDMFTETCDLNFGEGAGGGSEGGGGSGSNEDEGVGGGEAGVGGASDIDEETAGELWGDMLPWSNEALLNVVNSSVPPEWARRKAEQILHERWMQLQGDGELWDFVNGSASPGWARQEAERVLQERWLKRQYERNKYPGDSNTFDPLDLPPRPPLTVAMNGAHKPSRAGETTVMARTTGKRQDVSRRGKGRRAKAGRARERTFRR